MKLLIAEDNETLRKGVAHLFREQGHEVDEARDGTEALNKIREEFFNVIITDVEMPGMDGEATLEAACEKGVGRKNIIISSSHPADRLHEVFDPTGCLAVIEKGEPEQQAAFRMILDSIITRD